MAHPNKTEPFLPLLVEAGPFHTNSKSGDKTISLGPNL